MTDPLIAQKVNIGAGICDIFSHENCEFYRKPW